MENIKSKLLESINITSKHGSLYKFIIAKVTTFSGTYSITSKSVINTITEDELTIEEFFVYELKAGSPIILFLHVNCPNFESIHKSLIEFGYNGSRVDMYVPYFIQGGLQ